MKRSVVTISPLPEMVRVWVRLSYFQLMFSPQVPPVSIFSPPLPGPALQPNRLNSMAITPITIQILFPVRRFIHVPVLSGPGLARPDSSSSFRKASGFFR